ncbi:MAG: nucleotidyl transferase AbiEii/AbiGii toxin family protein [Bacteroidota bacterium]|nr:nucleotidyl transferase AbiEii/AbiGii toxin family protein [Bacteroidota bacterium]
MEKKQLQILSSELKIAPEQILREYWEIIVLNELSNEEWGSALGFKGGTALRLAYGSPRFSDDLDFSLLNPLKSSKIFSWANSVAKKLKLEVTDAADKQNTILVEFRIRDEALGQPIKQKIEISKRTQNKTKRDFELRLISSPTSNLQALFLVASIDFIWVEKISTLKSRKEPRDLFDLWYISQKLKRQLPSDLPKISPKTLKLTLNKYLPLKYQRIVEELTKL